MYNSRKWRCIAFLSFSLILGMLIAFSFWKDNRTYMGVEVLSEVQTTEYTEYVYQDFSNALMYNGEPAAVDVTTSTIYISQDIHADTKARDLLGDLKITHSGYQMLFGFDERFDDLYAAIAEGHTFPLLITDGTQVYMKYNVVFTTMPVIRMDGELSYQDEKNRDVLSGSVCLWSPNDEESGRYSVKSSNAQWHIRGETSTILPKKSWKISLKNKAGENKNLSFLGLGEDDDWLLNSMGFDDTKIREKLFMDLWNEMTSKKTYNYLMSSGEYVEAVINGRYNGIYLLQRRVDEKYLELEAEDILLKSTYYSAATAQEAYEIIYSSADAEYTYQQMEGIYTGDDCSIVNLDNFLDTNLFLQFSAAQDNVGIKNMYHVLKATSTGYEHYFIPWDTDMSFGLAWCQDEDFFLDHQLTLNSLRNRREILGVLNIYPDLFERMSACWFDLRNNILTQDNILTHINQYMTELVESGSYSRDKMCWGEYYNGTDTVEELYDFVNERLLQLDNYYAQHDTLS